MVWCEATMQANEGWIRTSKQNESWWSDV